MVIEKGKYHANGKLYCSIYFCCSIIACQGGIKKFELKKILIKKKNDHITLISKIILSLQPNQYYEI